MSLRLVHRSLGRSSLTHNLPTPTSQFAVLAATLGTFSDSDRHTPGRPTGLWQAGQRFDQHAANHGMVWGGG